MEISVIVPVYNVEKYLPKCLDSLCAQDQCVKEIILVNDGSTDGSLNICKKYAQNDSRIIVLDRQNGGVMSAIIAGVEAANSDYLGFVDSDDYVAPNMFYQLAKKMQETDADVVICDFYRVYGDGRKEYQFALPNNNVKDLYKKENGKFDLQLLPTLKNVECVSPYRWNKLFKKSAIINNYGFKDYHIRVGEDIASVIPTIFSVNSVAYIKEGLYYYFQRDNSLVHTYNRENFICWKKIIEVLKAAAEKYSYVFIPDIDDISLAILMSVCLFKIHISRLSKQEKIREYEAIGEDQYIRLLFGRVKIKTNFKHKIVFELLKKRRYKILSKIY